MSRGCKEGSPKQHLLNSMNMYPAEACSLPHIVWFGSDVTAGCLTCQGWECEELVQVLGIPADQAIYLIQDDGNWARVVGRGAPATVCVGAVAAVVAAAALLQHLD